MYWLHRKQREHDLKRELRGDLELEVKARPSATGIRTRACDERRGAGKRGSGSSWPVSAGLALRAVWDAEEQSILIDNLPFTVVGVTLPEFFGGPRANPDFYVPMHTNVVFDGSVSWAT
jgi:hypothetical protein